MRKLNISVFISASVLFLLFIMSHDPISAFAAKAGPLKSMAKGESKSNDSFSSHKMSDMSDFDPENPIIPTGDTIKIAVVASFSGPASANGQNFFNMVQWVAHDINKQGGIFVDGKKKLIQVLKADHQSRTDMCHKIVTRMCVQERVHVLWGTDGPHLMKIIQQVGKDHNVIVVNGPVTPDNLVSVENFNVNTFNLAGSTRAMCDGLLYYFGQIRKKEKKFYILTSDLAGNREYGEKFKEALKKFYPEAQLVGEDYSKYLLTDFAPYMTKIKASGAEVVLTVSWNPDAANMAKAAKSMGLNVVFGHVWMNDPNLLSELGVDFTKGWVHVGSMFTPVPMTSEPAFINLYNAWRTQQKKWKNPPYNSPSAIYGPMGSGGSWLNATYWLMSVIGRAQTTNAQKVIQLWEGDTYRGIHGQVLKMRACDHKVIQDVSVEVYAPPEEQKQSFTIPPYYWFKDFSFVGPTYRIPAKIAPPWMDQNLDRCKGKSEYE